MKYFCVNTLQHFRMLKLLKDCQRNEKRTKMQEKDNKKNVQESATWSLLCGE